MRCTKALNKILLIRPEMIGDTVLLTPIISAIKKLYPQAQIYMLLRPGMEELVKNNPDVAGWFFAKDFFPLLKEVRKESFDISIVFEDNPTPQYAFLSLLAGIPCRIGDKSRLLYGWSYNCGVWVDSADANKHHIELYLKLLEPLGIKEEKLPLKLYADSSAEERIEKILPKKEGNELFVGLHIGTGGGNRALLPETYAQVAALLQKQVKCKIFLIGGKREKETLERMKETIHFTYADMVDKLSLQELFSLIKRMDLFIGVDSGPLHIAAAFRVPVVAIYTAKDVNPARWLPWMTKSIAIKSDNSCSLKCSHRECDKDYCLKTIDAAQVTDAALKLIPDKRA